jgi:hypothetical protein
VRFHLDTPHLQGADAVEWVLAHAQPDGAVLHRGAGSGAIEFVPALLWPRLVYAEWAEAADDAGRPRRPLARGPIGGVDATAVIACEPERRGTVQRLRLEAR